MPLKRGKSRAAIADNIAAEMAAGRARDQAVAIALHEAGKSRKPPAKPRRRRK